MFDFLSLSLHFRVGDFPVTRVFVWCCGRAGLGQLTSGGAVRCSVLVGCHVVVLYDGGVWYGVVWFPSFGFFFRSLRTTMFTPVDSVMTMKPENFSFDHAL